MEYTIVKANEPDHLVTEVMYMLRQEWKPLGGPSAYIDPLYGLIIIQAMVREQR